MGWSLRRFRKGRALHWKKGKMVETNREPREWDLRNGAERQPPAGAARPRWASPVRIAASHMTRPEAEADRKALRSSRHRHTLFYTISFLSQHFTPARWVPFRWRFCTHIFVFLIIFFMFFLPLFLVLRNETLKWLFLAFFNPGSKFLACSDAESRVLISG